MIRSSLQEVLAPDQTRGRENCTRFSCIPTALAQFGSPSRVDWAENNPET